MTDRGQQNGGLSRLNQVALRAGSRKQVGAYNHQICASYRRSEIALCRSVFRLLTLYLHVRILCSATDVFGNSWSLPSLVFRSQVRYQVLSCVRQL